ncbi:MAG TPA: hypothetical protein VK189_01015 [Thermoplasmata archaeon]|nr:hypothetical protein [Thermoplasmata archaeon]
MLRPGSPWRTGITRVLALGPSRLALGLAIVLVLVSLALPFWSLSAAMGTDQNISSFSWATFTSDRYVRGVWDGTVILPYSSTLSPYRAVANVLGTAYLLDLVFLVVLAVVLALFSMEYGRSMPTLSLLILSLIVVGVALFALFYPIVAIPGAATEDVGAFTIGGFWGSASTSTPPTGWSWGPGLGWWILLLAAILGTTGAVFPYVKSVRAMIPAPPPGWRPSS